MFVLIKKAPLHIVAGYFPEANLPEDEHIIMMELPENIPFEFAKAIETDGVISIVKDVTKEKTALVSAAYARMDSAVYTAMAQVFQTTKSDSATAFYSTWQLMLEQPALFASEGLRTDKAIGAFALGAVLDTVEKVTLYASARIAEANAYSVQRMKLIETFKVERATILGS